MKIFEVAGEGKLHGLTVMSLDAFVKKEDDVEESLNEDANFMPAGDYQGYPIEVRKTKFNDKYFIAQTTRPIGKDPLKAPGATQDEALQNLRDKIDGEIAKKQVHKKNVTTVGFGAPFAQGVLRKGNQKFYVKFTDGKVLVSDTPEQGFRPVTKNSPQAISPSGSFKVDEIKAAGFDISTRYELVPTDNANEFEAKKHSIITSSNDKYVMPFPGMAIQHPDRGGVGESDMSGIMHAAKNYNKSFLITAELAEGGKKTFRVRAQSERAAREKFAQHHNQATIVSVKEEGVAEGLNERASQLLSAEDRNGVITVVVQAPDGTKRSLANENPRYINQWLDAKYGLTLPRSIMAKFVESDLSEAPGDFGLGANYRAVPDAEMQDLMGRSKNKTKTKRDKYDYPYVHGSNIEVKDEAGKTFDTDKLKAAIMTRPANILGQNAKFQHSETGTEAVFSIGLPALKGLAVNEKTGEFVVVDTCPGAGACQTYCYAMKGSYVMFKAVSMALARMLNFLLNDPAGFVNQLNSEIASARSKYAKKGARIVVRWHEAGDFFSNEYLDVAYGVAKANPDVGFYAYTKMGDVANAARPKNFNMNFSQGAKSSQEKKVNITRTKHSKVVPKDMFFDLIARKGNELIKDAKGRMQFASPENLDKFKTIMAQKYAIDKDSILTYDQIMKTPIGDTPKWNVFVMPGDGDNSANRNDVIGTYLLFH